MRYLATEVIASLPRMGHSGQDPGFFKKLLTFGTKIVAAQVQPARDTILFLYSNKCLRFFAFRYEDAVELFSGVNSEKVKEVIVAMHYANPWIV